MKTESIKILENLCAYLHNEKNAAMNTAICNTANVLDMIHAINADIEKIIRIETPNTTRAKFNLWNYVLTDKWQITNRPQMACIYSEEGYKIASDANILVAVKEAYPAEDEKTLINKKGEKFYNPDAYKDAEGIKPEQLLRYPKWKQIIPTRNTITVPVDLDKFNEARKDWNEYKKLSKIGAAQEEKHGYIKIGPAYFKMDKFAQMAAFMAAYNTNVLCLAEDRPAQRAAMARNENGDLCIIMPVRFDGDENSFKGYAI